MSQWWAAISTTDGAVDTQLIQLGASAVSASDAAKGPDGKTDCQKVYGNTTEGTTMRTKRGGREG